MKEVFVGKDKIFKIARLKIMEVCIGAYLTNTKSRLYIFEMQEESLLSQKLRHRGEKCKEAQMKA